MYCSIDFLKQFSTSISKGLLNLRIIFIITYKETHHKEEYKQETTTDTSASIVYFAVTCTKTCAFFNIPHKFTTFEIY